MENIHIHITGVVQGVGMRPFVYREALAYGIAGWVLNAGDGVHIEAHAESAAMNAFLCALREQAPAAAHIEGIDVVPCDAATGGNADDAAVGDICNVARAGEAATFRILASDAATERSTLVSPDIATCPDCLRELFDPGNRRFHYPFINCTNCGPRFTIIRSLPYDRSATSMNAFPMCPSCAKEYADPLDRRFHAQPDACFECGPHITWREREGGTAVPATAAPAIGTTREESDAIIERCAELLKMGGIVAIKGLGGFHLTCDAANDAAVRDLRRRKRRSNKPLAVMMADPVDVESRCMMSAAEQNLLESSIRPIVLLRRRAHSNGIERRPRTPAGGKYDGRECPDIAPSVAFDAPDLGVMLPYTPIQHLLLRACRRCGIFALVMTSGNISDEPIEIDDDAAWERLVVGGVADALLGNNREILSRYDDSVVRVAAGSVRPVRRARGYAPQPLKLPAMSRPSTSQAPVKSSPPSAILACGSEQKATIAFTREGADGTAACFMSQHIGDVEQGAAFDAWHEARRRLEKLFDMRAEALACDLHPQYLASQWARAEAERQGLALVEIQHHHAHIAAGIAEAATEGALGTEEPVIGFAFDGTGMGTDGSIWGGEVLVATLSGYERAAHLAPWRLPGGAAAVRNPLRNAYGLLSACGLLKHPAARGALERFSAGEQSALHAMVERGLNSPLTSSMGRLLDALGAITGICDVASYEGEPAIELEAAAQRALQQEQAMASDARYRFELNVEQPDAAHAPGSDIRASQRRVGERPAHKPIVINPTPLVCAALDDLAAGYDRDVIALAIHHAVVEMMVDIAVTIRTRTAINTVILGGGVFMNRIILEAGARRLRDGGFCVHIPQHVPVNDGGISYGQAAIARARLT